MMPKVSVIIPTYNHAKYLSEAIESVLDQTYKDYEIIIIDDGSTDNTKDILMKYIDTYPGRIRYFYQQNRGVSAARNKGIDESGGEFLALLDSDNTASTVWIENLLKGFLNKEVGVSVGKTVALKANTLIQSIYVSKTKGDDGGGRYYRYVDSTNCMIRKSVIREVGKFDESFGTCEDLDFNERVNASPFKIYFIHDAVVFYRYREKFLPLLFQWYRYGQDKILFYKKYPSRKRSVFQEGKESLLTNIYLIKEIIVNVFKFVSSKKNRSIIFLFDSPVQLLCSLSNDLGKLIGRFRYNLWF